MKNRFHYARVQENRYTVFPLVCIVLFCFLFSGLDVRASPHGDKGKATDVLRRIVEFNARYPQEKVYLHFDNTGYFRGETMWFAAYAVRTDKGTATDISRVLYVELLNPSGEVVDREKLRLVDGMANGCFHLDSLLGSGFYEVRAYTRYMLNWPDVDVFSRVFPVFNPPRKAGDWGHLSLDKIGHKKRLPNHREEDGVAEEDEGKTILHFYPEGGWLVKGVRSRVAYTVVRDGKEVERGTTEVTPADEGTNFVYQGQAFSLPEAREEGCVVRVDVSDEEQLKTTFRVSKGLEGETLAYLVMHGGTVQMADTFTARPMTERSVPRYRLSDGVSQLVVFNLKGQLLCDRLLFKCPEVGYQDSIRWQAVGSRLAPCGKVVLDLTATPNARFSFAAADAESMTGGMTGNLKTWMLLSSEVKGYIDHPDYYFESDDSVHRQAADLLMMVQGWRRYDWHTMVGDSAFNYVQPLEDKLYLRGRVLPKKQGVRASYLNLNAFLWNRKGQTFSGKTITDRDGNFLWAMPGLRGDHNLQIKVKQEQKNADYYVTIDRHFSPEARAYQSYDTEQIPFAGGNLQMDGGTEDDSLSHDMMEEGNRILQEVEVKGRKRWNLLGNKQHQVWYDEDFGRQHAAIYYDCDAAADELADRGEDLPTVYSWLASKNEFFRADEPREAYFEQKGNQPITDEGEVENEFQQTNTARSPNLYRDGYSYKNRKIIWILNNKYAGMTNMGRGFKLETLDDIKTKANEQDLFNQNGRKEYRNFQVLEGTIEQMPWRLDDVKSIYISEHPYASTHYLQCSDAQNDAVTIFLYTHPAATGDQTKGLRKTHYWGYHAPETFQMVDYSVLPPTEDFRRTLYWNPQIKADANGKAQVEFYNNSSCTDIYITAEGITKDGKFIVNE